MGNDLSVKLGEKAVSDYNKTAKTVLSECQDTLKKSNVPIPIVDSKDKKENVAGLQVEHADEDTQTKVEDKQDEDKNYKDGKAAKEGKFSSNTSIVNNSYSKIVSKGNKIIKTSSSSSSGVSAVQNFMESLDDIEDAGKSHIAALDDQLPESGNISGGFTTSYQKNTGSSNFSFQGNVTNAWQNKKKNFGIVASASVGYDNEKVSGETFDFDIKDLEDLDENIDVEDIDKSVKSSNKSTSDSSDVNDSEVEEISKAAEEHSNEGGANKFGSIAVNMRLKKEKFTYGAGFVSTFSPEKTQVHDQFITVKHNKTGSFIDGVGADLMRRTVVSFDEETGERYSRSQMKLTVDLVDRGKDEDIVEEVPDDLSLTEENKLFTNAVRSEAEADIKKHKVKDGSGLDVDFKYDQMVCGAELQYGINVINNKKNKERLTIAPVVGAFDHSSSETEPEAFQTTLGVASEYKKKWKNGSSLDASIHAVSNRVVQSGSSPSDLCYVVANGRYNNPRKKLSVSVDAGVIKNKISMAYIEASASKQMKNFDLEVQAGISKTKTGNNVDNSFQVLVTGKYNIPYKTKK